MLQSKKIGIVGGGISGLSAGYALRNMGLEVTIYEQASNPGGVIRTIREKGWLVEPGPNTLIARSQKLWELIEGLGLQDQVEKAGQIAKKRYVVKNGTPLPLPASLVEFITTDLLSARAKLRLFKEPFVARSTDNESVASFFGRRLGEEVVDYLVNPFIAGIYAGDPKRLSMRHTFRSLYSMEKEHGSIVKGSFKRKKETSGSTPANGLISFDKGVGQLIDGLQRNLRSDLRLENRVVGVSRTGSGWTVAVEGEHDTRKHDGLICTAPLFRLPDIEFDIDGKELLDDLSGMRYAPIATVALGFDRSQVEHPLDGFGMLIPEVESRNILGCLFSSSLFQNRAPNGRVLLTLFVGGERRPEQVAKAEKEIVDLAMEDLQALLGITGEPCFRYIHKWHRAIPQYELGHQAYLDKMDRLEEINPGLFFSGSFGREVSVPGCIDQAYETAENAAAFLES